MRTSVPVSRNTADPPDEKGEPCRFNTRIIEGITGMNRGSLRYFEKRGVLNPTRTDETGYRLYSILDVNHLIGLALLINADVGASEAWDDKDVPGTLADLDATLDGCMSANALRLAWHKAIEESITRLHDLYNTESMMVPRTIQMPRRLMWFNQDKPGGRVTRQALDRGYVKLQPVCSATCVYGDSWLENGGSGLGRWGVSIPADYVDAVRSEKTLDIDTAETIEAHEMACIPLTLPTDATMSLDLEPDETVRTTLLKFVERQGLTTCGPAMLMDYLPIGMTLYATLNVPVERAGCARHGV